MVVLCANVFYLSAANVPPYSETSDRTSPPNVGCCREPGLLFRESGRARPNVHPVRRENLRSD